jgi:transaldolase / glucose-6-phosphate isomerase
VGDVQAHIPQDLLAAVVSAVERAIERRVAQGLREADGTLWGGPDTPEVENRLGWIDVAQRMLGQVDDLQAFADSVRDEGIEDVVLLGMGGSSLAPEVLRRSLPAPAGRPRLHVLDSTDAGAVRALQGAIDLGRTLFVVSSKSGGTIEPLSMLAHFWALVEEQVAALAGRQGGTLAGQQGGALATEPGQRFVAITDPGTGLEQLARERGFRRVFGGDPDIGGRYSALSPFGIVPAVLAGFEARALLEGAAAAWEMRVDLDSDSVEEMHGLPAPVWLGAALGALARGGRDKLTFVVPQPLDGLGLWEEQLFAESTGKRGTGILPVADEPLGDPEVYGEDRVFVYIPDTSAPAMGHASEMNPPAIGHASEVSAPAVGHASDVNAPAMGHSHDHAHTRARVWALADAGHPVLEIPLSGPLDLGRAFMFSELAVAVAGWGLGINPFDQPDVQRAKDATNRVLERFEQEGSLPEVQDAGESALRALLGDAAPPSYVGIMGYLQPSNDFDAAVAELRRTVRDARRVTTTFGYGPRFQHSTGQFHKGGPKTGRFLQLIHDGVADEDRAADEEIPGKPYSFNTLKNAQAIGDLQTLRELGLPAERVRLHGDDPAAALRTLTDKIKEML